MNMNQMTCPNCGIQLDANHNQAMCGVAARKLAAERRKTFYTTLATAGLSLAVIGFLARDGMTSSNGEAAVAVSAASFEAATPATAQSFNDFDVQAAYVDEHFSARPLADAWGAAEAFAASNFPAEAFAYAAPFAFEQAGHAFGAHLGGFAHAFAAEHESAIVTAFLKQDAFAAEQFGASAWARHLAFHGFAETHAVARQA